MTTDIGTRDLEAFVTLARISRYTIAAASLGMTQSTLSKRIKELEAKLQVRLFDRTTRHVSLTLEGQEFLHHAAHILDQIERSLRDVRERASGQRGRLSIAAGPHMAGNLLPSVIAEFAAHHPHVEIILHDCRSQETLGFILSEQAEIGVTVSPSDMIEHPQLDFHRVVERNDPLMAVLHKDNSLALQPTVTWDDIRTSRILLLRQSSAASRLVASVVSAQAVRLDLVFEVSLIDTALGMAASGYGIVVLPSYVKSRHRADSLIYRPIQGTSAQFHFSLQHLRGRSLSGPATNFINLLRAHVEAW
ncbi:MAG: LysR family transcriptional regulator [Neoaquamicrobium sediminum]